MSSSSSRARSQMLIVIFLCIAAIGCCDDQVFIDIHLSVDEPVLSQALAINAWAFSAIPGGQTMPLNINLQNCDTVQAKLSISKPRTTRTSLCISLHSLRPVFPL